MGLDANGIWIYDEFEDAAPFSTLLNKLAQSTSDAVEGAVLGGGWSNSGILWGTNWEDYQPAVANNHVEYSVVGLDVVWRGLARRTANLSGGGTVVMFTVPDIEIRPGVSLRPTRQVITGAMTSASWSTGAASTGTAHTHPIMASATSGPTLRVAVGTNGEVSVTTGTGQTMVADNWVSMADLRWRCG